MEILPFKRKLSRSGSRGANIEKLMQEKWLEGPNLLLNDEEWPRKPEFESSTKVLEEQRKVKEALLCARERKADEWNELLERQSYRRT